MKNPISCAVATTAIVLAQANASIVIDSKSLNGISSTMNLTNAGTLDWAKWADGGANGNKSPLVGKIGGTVFNASAFGTGATYSAIFITLPSHSWTDGDTQPDSGRDAFNNLNPATSGIYSQNMFATDGSQGWTTGSFTLAPGSYDFAWLGQRADNTPYRFKIYAGASLIDSTGQNGRTVYDGNNTDNLSYQTSFTLDAVTSLEIVFVREGTVGTVATADGTSLATSAIMISQTSAVPEPSAYALVGSCTLGIVALARRRNRKSNAAGK